jgi:hypothetical protein
MFESKSYSFRLSPELAEQLNALLPELGGGEVSGIREALELLMLRAAAPPATTAPPVTESDEYMQLQAVLHDARDQVAAIQKEYDALTAQYDELLKSHDAGHDALKQRAEAAEAHAIALQEANAVLARDLDAGKLSALAIVLELDAPTEIMLRETCKHLDAAAGHYPQLADFAGVTPGVLLVSMFRRYVKERRTEWFFPLSILPPERIAEIEMC